MTAMRLIGRTLFRIMAVVVWLCMAAIFIEMAAQARAWYVDRYNPCVHAYNVLPSWRKAGAVHVAAEPVTPPAPEEIADALRRRAFVRAPFFFTLNEDDRISFAVSHRIAVFLLDAAGARTRVYSFTPSVAQDALLEDRAGLVAAERLRALVADARAGETGLYTTIPELAAKGFEPEAMVWPVDETDAVAGIFLTEDLSKDRPGWGNPLWDRFYFSYLPGATYKTPDFNVSVNNIGFRGENTVLPKPPGTWRVVCIGASTTEEGPEDSITYPALLEKELRESHPGVALDVVNGGIPGANTFKEKVRTPDFLVLEPDEVIFLEGVNDLLHYHFAHWADAHSSWQKRWRTSRVLCALFNKTLFPDDTAMPRAFVENGMANIAFIANRLRGAGARIALASFPAPDPAACSATERAFFQWDLERHWFGGTYVTMSTYLRALALFNEQTKALCEKEGYLYIPLAEAFSHGNTAVFTDICHMKVDAIARKADIIAAAIARAIPEKR